MRVQRRTTVSSTYCSAYLQDAQVAPNDHPSLSHYVLDDVGHAEPCSCELEFLERRYACAARAAGWAGRSPRRVSTDDCDNVVMAPAAPSAPCPAAPSTAALRGAVWLADRIDAAGTWARTAPRGCDPGDRVVRSEIRGVCVVGVSSGDAPAVATALQPTSTLHRRRRGQRAGRWCT